MRVSGVAVRRPLHDERAEAIPAYMLAHPVETTIVSRLAAHVRV